jgi:hypothetical protein
VWLLFYLPMSLAGAELQWMRRNSPALQRLIHNHSLPIYLLVIGLNLALCCAIYSSLHPTARNKPLDTHNGSGRGAVWKYLYR